MMKLEVVFNDGRKVTLDSVTSFNVTEECRESNAEKIHTEGKLFEVNPLEIDRSKFEKPMSNAQQELTRIRIQEAFSEVDKHPEKYASPFYTLIPEKNWDGFKAVEELKKDAEDMGGMMADWVQQALEWAQRIFNGESWEAICNDTDTTNWYRMILWKNGACRLVGGSQYLGDEFGASCIDIYDYYFYNKVIHAVPLVVIKKK